MKKIKIRTKVEAGLVAMLLLAITASATVLISDSELVTSSGNFRIDFTNASIGTVLVLEPQATEPASPTVGMIYCNATDDHMYYYNGTNWIDLAVTVNSGTALNVYNGSWVAHGLPGDPHINGSITLSLRGISSITVGGHPHVLRQPSVIQSNFTHFQIEFLMWNATTWSLEDVSVGEAQTVYWDAIWRG